MDRTWTTWPLLAVAVWSLAGCSDSRACRRLAAKKAAEKAAAEAEASGAVAAGDTVVIVEGEVPYGEPWIEVVEAPSPEAAPQPTVRAPVATPAAAPKARTVRTPVPSLGRPGYVVFEEDGRLWVFRTGSGDLLDFLASGEPAKSITLVGAGPGGRTLRGPDRETVDGYLDVVGRPTAPTAASFARPGFHVEERDGRLWVFEEGSKELAAFLASGEPAQRVTQVGAGPEGRTLIGADRETLASYRAAVRYGRPGFAVFADDGRLWVFRTGTEDLHGFLAVGEPAKSVTLIGAGPAGETVRAPDRDVIAAWLAALE